MSMSGRRFVLAPRVESAIHIYNIIVYNCTLVYTRCGWTVSVSSESKQSKELRCSDAAARSVWDMPCSGSNRRLMSVMNQSFVRLFISFIVSGSGSPTNATHSFFFRSRCLSDICTKHTLYIQIYIHTLKQTNECIPAFTYYTKLNTSRTYCLLPGISFFCLVNALFF